MKLRIDRIEEDPREQELGDWANAPVGESLEGAVQSLEGRLVVRRVEESVFVRGEVRASVQRNCDRCGAAIVANLGGPVVCCLNCIYMFLLSSFILLSISIFILLFRILSLVFK